MGLTVPLPDARFKRMSCISPCISPAARQELASGCVETAETVSVDVDQAVELDPDRPRGVEGTKRRRTLPVLLKPQKETPWLHRITPLNRSPSRHRRPSHRPSRQPTPRPRPTCWLDRNRPSRAARPRSARRSRSWPARAPGGCSSGPSTPRSTAISAGAATSASRTTSLATATATPASARSASAPGRWRSARPGSPTRPATSHRSEARSCRAAGT
jgi:hypothetical protein